MQFSDPGNHFLAEKQLFPHDQLTQKEEVQKQDACQVPSPSISIRVILSLQVLQLDAWNEKGLRKK